MFLRVNNAKKFLSLSITEWQKLIMEIQFAYFHNYLHFNIIQGRIQGGGRRPSPGFSKSIKCKELAILG